MGVRALPHAVMLYVALNMRETCEKCNCCLLQACLVQLGPKECLLVSSDRHSDSGRLRQLLSRCGLLITDRKRSLQLERQGTLSTSLPPQLSSARRTLCKILIDC